MAKTAQRDELDVRKVSLTATGLYAVQNADYPPAPHNTQHLKRFHRLLDQSPDYVAVLSRDDMCVLDANQALVRLLGKSLETLIGQPFSCLGLGDFSSLFPDSCEGADDHAKCQSMPARIVEVEFHSGADVLWLELAFNCSMVDEQCYGVVVGRDISERRHRHKMMAAILAEKEALLENAMVGIAMLHQRKITSCNRRCEDLFGYTPSELIGQPVRILYPNDDGYEAFGALIYARLGQEYSITETLMLIRKDGTVLWCEVTGHALDQANPNNGSIWIFTDVSARRQMEERAKFLAYHDTLTGVPNLLLLQDRMQQIVSADTQDASMALMVLDIDHFRAINDSQGYSFGDKLLVEVAQRLKSCLKDNATLCRKGGDEFLILLPHLRDAEECISFLAEVMSTLSMPFSLKGLELVITGSTGIAMYPDDGKDLDSLLKKAEMAMYRAKDVGRNTYRFYDEEMNREVVDQLSLHFGLRRALEADEFELYYQPQIDIGSGALIGAEALIRWNHPELGLVSPARFIPVAEESGLIVPIGEWVLCTACREAVKWQMQGKPDLVVAVNLSALQFKRGDIEQSVIRALAESGLNPNLLELELTESILLSDTEKVLATVIRLKHLGIRLSIDDFGTGYSSLSYLKRFKVDKLKIDQSFVRDLAQDSEDAAIVLAVIQMARSLGLRTIAEGVEDQRALDLLRLYRCDEAQGYFHAHPMPAQDFYDYLRTLP